MKLKQKEHVEVVFLVSLKCLLPDSNRWSDREAWMAAEYARILLSYPIKMKPQDYAIRIEVRTMNISLFFFSSRCGNRPVLGLGPCIIICGLVALCFQPIGPINLAFSFPFLSFFFVHFDCVYYCVFEA